MKNSSFILLAIILLISLTGTAQEKWCVEFRPGLNFPTVDMGNVDSQVGFGFELTAAYKLMPHLAVYAGWGLNQFKGPDRDLKEDIIFKETGFTFGLLIIRPIGTSSFSYVASAGAVYNQIQLENNSGDFSMDTGYGFGWQLAAGVDYEVIPNISFRPMLRYRSLSRDVENSNIPLELKLNYVSFGIGLTLDF